jgi:hypothetical protein
MPRLEIPELEPDTEARATAAAQLVATKGKAALKLWVALKRVMLDIEQSAPKRNIIERLEFGLYLANQLQQPCARRTCPKGFVAKTPNQRYCSDDCSLDVLREKKRTWWRANRGRNAKRGGA